MYRRVGVAGVGWVGLIGTPAAEHARLVAWRQQCLDELERRDLPGFRRWLATDAGPASDPSRYIRPRSGSCPDRWDGWAEHPALGTRQTLACWLVKS